MGKIFIASKPGHIERIKKDIDKEKTLVLLEDTAPRLLLVFTVHLITECKELHVIPLGDPLEEWLLTENHSNKVVFPGKKTIAWIPKTTGKRRTELIEWAKGMFIMKDAEVIEL